MRPNPLATSFRFFFLLWMCGCGCGESDRPASPDPAGPAPSWLDGARNAIEAREYYASESRRGLQAPNRRHDLRVYFEPEGIRVFAREDRNAPALLELRAVHFGRSGALGRVEPGRVTHAGARVEIERPKQGLLEWYENSPAGIEQGFTIDAPPTGAGPLWLELAVAKAEPALHGDGITFQTETGRGLRYQKLLTLDANGAEVPSHFELADAGFRIVVEDAGAQYPILIDPLITEDFDGVIESNQIDALLGHSAASAGDVNGDGYGDVIVGADFFDNGETNEGVAFIFHGGPDGIGDRHPGNADTILESNQAGSRFGYRTRSAGDVNGDGYGDVIVSGFRYDAGQTDEGAAWIFLGGPSGIASGNPATAHAQLEGNQAGARFGIDVASAGDVNGDGYGDVLVGAYFYDNPEVEEGAAFLFLGGASGIADGGPSTADAMFESNQAGAQLGFRVASAGDIDADGFGDIILGALGFDDTGADKGAALVFYGSSAGIASGDPLFADELLIGNSAGEALGTSVSAAGDVNGDGYGDVVVGSPGNYGGQGIAPFFRVYLGSAAGLVTGLGFAKNIEGFASLVASAGDVNGDGYGDILIGAQYYEDGQSGEGGAFVYFGSASGTALVGVLELQSNQVNAQMGLDGGSAGDVNGDGFNDVIVGARYFDGPQDDEGAVFIYHGSGTGIESGAAAHARLESDQAFGYLGTAVASAGDVNRDGFDDLIVGAYSYDAGETAEGAAFVFLGSATGMPNGTPASVHAQLESNQAGAFLGSSVASAGDVNGDGYGDVVVGAPRYDAPATEGGAAFVFLGGPFGIGDGSPANAHAQLESDQAGVRFGSSVASAGDVDGDGYSDLIVSSPFYDTAAGRAGAVFVFLGSAAGVSDGGPGTAHARIDSDQDAHEYFGEVASAGDVNGDGFSDVIFGAQGYIVGPNQGGAAFVFHGSATGIASSDVNGADARLESTQPGGALGSSVASAGDVNGDGYGDVIVGARLYNAGSIYEGAAFVFLGGASGIGNRDPNTADARLESDQPNAFMGRSVSSAGDVNGDGYADIIVGATGYDNGQTNEGAAFIFLGSASGVASGDPGDAHAVLESNQEGAAMGVAVAGAGDINGDGFADVIVGVANYDNGEENEGAAFLYLGSEDDDSRTAGVRQLRSDGSGTLVPHGGIAHSNDAFTVELDAASPRGRELAKLEVEACPPGTPFGDLACDIHLSPSWIDLGLVGDTFNEKVHGLEAGEFYHWRARILYAPLGATQPGITPIAHGGPWRRPGGHAGTGDIRMVPEPDFGLGLAAGLALLLCLRRRNPDGCGSTRPKNDRSSR